MSSNLRIESVGQTIVFLYSTDRVISGLFPQAKIIKPDGDIFDTVDLTENGNVAGEYRANVTITVEGIYDVIYIPYTDAGHTTESERAPRASEVFNVRVVDDKFGGTRAGGGVDIDIPDLAKQLKKEFNKETKKEKTKEVDLKPILKKLEALEKKEVVIPPVNIDGALQDLTKEIKEEIKTLASQKTEINLNPLLIKIEALAKGDINLSSQFKALQSVLAELKKEKTEFKNMKIGIDIKLAEQKELIIQADDLNINRFKMLVESLQAISLAVNKKNPALDELNKRLEEEQQAIFN